MAGCALFPVQGIAQWIDMKTRRPLASLNISTTAIATKVNRFLKNLAIECGMDPTRVSSHSMGEGCSSTLYANGVDAIDIQRWGR